MNGGPVSMKLRYLQRYLHQRADDPAPLSLLEIQQLADCLGALVPVVDAFEAAAVPHNLRASETRRLRLIEGGRP